MFLPFTELIYPNLGVQRILTGMWPVFWNNKNVPKLTTVIVVQHPKSY